MQAEHRYSQDPAVVSELSCFESWPTKIATATAAMEMEMEMEMEGMVMTGAHAGRRRTTVFSSVVGIVASILSSERECERGRARQDDQPGTHTWPEGGGLVRRVGEARMYTVPVPELRSAVLARSAGRAT